jgi:S1-C subfamily serine protease
MWAMVTTRQSYLRGYLPNPRTQVPSVTIRTVNTLDILIVLLLVLSAVNGYRRGAVLQLTAYAGLLLGLVAGALLAPVAAGFVTSPLAQAGVALSTLLVMAAIGDALGWLVGSKIWVIARRSVLRTFDSVAGSIVAVVAVLVTVWFIGLNLANGPVPELSRQIRGSAVVRTIDDTLPRPPSLLASMRQLLNRFGFPEIFADLPPAPAGPVKAPTEGEAAQAADAARDSTVRILGKACGAIHEGSGFVVAPRYVVTNAHVVAGMAAPQVQLQNGGSQAGVTVLFDARLDIAVLRVATAPGPTLALDEDEEDRGTGGAVLGYPGGGSLDIEAAAVRRSLHAVGRDIYGESVVQRDVYELQTLVRPGNSGGPFVLTDGSVAGVVVAASTTDTRIGYAITSPQVVPLVQKATGRTAAVSTGGCTR